MIGMVKIMIDKPERQATYRAYVSHCRSFGVRPWCWVRWKMWTKGWIK